MLKPKVQHKFKSVGKTESQPCMIVPTGQFVYWIKSDGRNDSKLYNNTLGGMMRSIEYAHRMAIYLE